MKYLLVDLGHSRLKWVTVEPPSEQWFPKASFYTLDTLYALFTDLWASLPSPDKMVVANVCTIEEQQILNVWVQKYWINTVVEYLVSDDRFMGLQNAYRQAPQTLGVDRWLGMIAAHYLYPAHNMVVVDCGTCITIDALLQTGQHLGGWIVPGYTSLRQLLQERAGLTVPMIKISQDQPMLGCSTLDGIENGLSLMLAGYLHHALACIQKDSDSLWQIILTGGDAPILKNCFMGHALHEEPHLVLKGISYRASLDIKFG